MQSASRHWVRAERGALGCGAGELRDGLAAEGGTSRKGKALPRHFLIRIFPWYSHGSRRGLLCVAAYRRLACRSEPDREKRAP